MGNVDTTLFPPMILPPPGAGAVGYPSYIRSAKFVISGSSDDTASDFDAVISTSDGAAATVKCFDLPSGAILHEIGWRVAVSFNAEVKLSIGDSDDVNGYAQLAEVGATVGSSAGNLWTTKSILMNEQYAGDSDGLADTTAVGAYQFLMPRMHYNSSKPGEFMTVDVTLSDTEATTGVLEVYVWYDLALLQSALVST